MFKQFLIVLSMGCSVSLWAGTTEHDFAKSKEYAKALRGESLNAMQQFHPESAFKDYDKSPSQTRYYTGAETEKNDFNQAVQKALKQDPGGKTVIDHFGKHRIDIDPNNAAINASKQIEHESHVRTQGVFCADGRCTESAATQDDNFSHALTSVAGVGAVGQEFSQTQGLLFGGHSVQCKIWSFDFIDCCSDKGWGEALNLAHCRAEDKALGQAKLNYLVHYIGEYCHKRVLGVCVEHKRSYCVFNTKMARLMQEEGRLKQLNPNAMGAAKYPNCVGLSVEELQRLDMSRIEFLRPVYPYHDGAPRAEAGIAISPLDIKSIQDEVVRRVQKKVDR